MYRIFSFSLSFWVLVIYQYLSVFSLKRYLRVLLLPCWANEKSKKFELLNKQGMLEPHPKYYECVGLTKLPSLKSISAKITPISHVFVWYTSGGCFFIAFWRVMCIFNRSKVEGLGTRCINTPEIKGYSEIVEIGVLGEFTNHEWVAKMHPTSFLEEVLFSTLWKIQS